MHKSFKFRLYPNTDQEQALAQQFGCGRFVYNLFLEIRNRFYELNKTSKKKGLTYVDTCAILAKVKYRQEYEWLQNAYSQSLQQSLKNLDAAFKNFFRDKARSKHPKFKSKRGKQAIGFPQNFSVDEEHGFLYLPKLTPVKVVLHREIEGTMKSVTVSKTSSGKYFASILCEVEGNVKQKTRGGEVGIDLGLKHFVVTSENERVACPQYFRRSGQRIAWLHRDFSRKQKGSENREKARIRLAQAYEKITEQRKNFLHKLSRRLIDENQAIYVEDLNIVGMQRSRGAAKSITDASWSEFVRQLEYKGKWYGCKVVQVDRFFPSSKTCRCCGFVNKDLKLSDRDWYCPNCGSHLDRDLNAAINILREGRAGTAQTNTPVERRKPFGQSRRSRKLPALAVQ